MAVGARPIVLAALGLFLLPTFAVAQERVLRAPAQRPEGPAARAGDGIPVIRGEGTRAPRPTDLRPAGPPPRSLDPSAKAALLKGLKLETGKENDGIVALDTSRGPWRVSPLLSYFPERVWLGFSNVRLFQIEPDSPPTAWLYSTDPVETPTSLARLLLAPLPHVKHYLLDCAVQPEDGFYRVRVYPGETEHTFTGTGHILLVYEAVDTSLAQIEITGHGRVGPWRFYGCEVSPLK